MINGVDNKALTLSDHLVSRNSKYYTMTGVCTCVYMKRTTMDLNSSNVASRLPINR